jgi:hypothetical protein
VEAEHDIHASSLSKRVYISVSTSMESESGTVNDVIEVIYQYHIFSLYQFLFHSY